MATLTALKFNTPEGAEQMLEKVKKKKAALAAVFFMFTSLAMGQVQWL